MAICSIVQWALDVWLAGCDFDELRATAAYRNASIDDKDRIFRNWISCDHIFWYDCKNAGINIEQARVVRTLAKPRGNKNARPETP